MYGIVTIRFVAPTSCSPAAMTILLFELPVCLIDLIWFSNFYFENIVCGLVVA